MTTTRATLRNPWVGFVLRRAAGLVCVCVALVVASFALVRAIPGNPGLFVAGTTASSEQIQQARVRLGLDKPFLTQFEHYVSNLAHGNFGTSFINQQSVDNIFTSRVGSSAALAVAGLLIVMLVGIPLGMIMGGLTRDGRRPHLEIVFTGSMSVLGAVPEFLMATLLAAVFAVYLRWLPVAGTGGISTLVLPALAVSILPTAVLARVVRVETLSAMAQDYMRTARGKRLPQRLLFFRHALPNVLTAALTIAGLLFSGLIAGAVVVENVFARPGLGTALTSAVLNRDYPVIQGMVIFFGLLLVLVNTLIDVLLAVIDPRSLASES